MTTALGKKTTTYTAISLDGGGGASVPALEDQAWWRLTHSLAFFLGGSTFILGTLCYFYPDWAEGAEYGNVGI